MATTVTKVVDPDSGSGYDYVSLSLWEAGQQGDLTGARDEIAVAKCRCTGGTADTTSVTINGWTTSATQYIKVWTDPAESYRHNGTYQTGNKYRIEVANAVVVYNAENYGIIDGIQIYLTSTNGSNQVGVDLRQGTTPYNFTVKNCIIRGYSSNSQTYHEGIRAYDTGSFLANEAKTFIINNIIYNFYSGYGIVHYCEDADAKAYIYNNTIVNCTTYGLYRGLSGTPYAINNLIYGCTGGSTGTWGAGSGYNATDRSSIGYTVTGGATADRVSQTFTFVGAADFHIASNDAGAIGYGLNLYNDANFPFQTDIDGEDRGGAAAAWDIGADEYVAAGGSSIVPLLLHQYRARRQ